jgi:hypothetical protein
MRHVAQSWGFRCQILLFSESGVELRLQKRESLSHYFFNCLISVFGDYSRP